MAKKATRKKTTRKKATRKKASRRKKSARGKSSRRRLWLRIALGFLIVFGALLLGLWLFIVSLVERVASEALGGEVDLFAVTSFWSRKVELHGVAYRLPNASERIIRDGRVELTLAAPAYTGNTTIEELLLRDLVIRLGPSSFPQPAPPTNSAPPAPSAPPAAEEEIRWPQRIRFENLRVELDVGLPDGRRIAIEHLNGVIVPKGEEMVIEDLAGRFLDGRLQGAAEYEPKKRAWRAQLRLAEARLREAVEGTSLEGGMTSGELNAFMELRSAPDDGLPVGAGWISLGKARVWQLPVFSTVLDSLSLAAGASDLVENARLKCRVDHGRVWFDDLRAIGSPVSLYGHGSMELDGTKLRADFVPRIGRSGLVDSLPVVGKPSQLLLDIAKGLAVEVQLRGSLRDPKISTLPLPVISRPLQEFFELVGGD